MVFRSPGVVLIVVVRREMARAIYSGISGASLQSVVGLGSIWRIPCDAEINVAFKIGDQTYPVHPLDTNSNDVLKSRWPGLPRCSMSVLGSHIHSLSAVPVPAYFFRVPPRPHITISFSGLLSVSSAILRPPWFMFLSSNSLPTASPERLSPYQLWRFRRWQREYHR